ncbi:MAG: cupin domain-containing protein [Bacteroidetes bacterium]|nr:cupin domain-containing protein [Bacteroidota bacterium]
MKIEVKNIAQAFSKIEEYWSPALLAQLNGQDVRIAKLKGEFTWHKHDLEDELFLVIQGELFIHLEDEVLQIKTGEMVIIPRGVLHKPLAPEEVQVLLFEPTGTLNTGDQENELTKRNLKDLR